MGGYFDDNGMIVTIIDDKERMMIMSLELDDATNEVITCSTADLIPFNHAPN